MINELSLKAVNSSRFGQHFVKPLPESYSFANIPGTIKKLLGAPSIQSLPVDTLSGKRAEKVVFLFIDSFGWEFWQKYQAAFPFLKRFLDQGVVSKLTSQFPSTTSAHVTTIHTGLPIGQSGLFEWFYYEPKLDAIIAPLLFSFAGKKERDTLMSTGISPRKIYPQKTIYKDLNKHEIQSFIFQYKDYTPSTYSDVVFEGATEVVPYRSLAHGLTLLSNKINNTTGPAYYFYYYDAIDTAGHVDGPHSAVHNAEIYNFFTTLETLFYQEIKNQKGLTILLSADHGMVKVDPKTNFYLNQVDGIENYLARNKNGQLLVPAGACRDMFVYAQKDKVDSLKTLLEKKLEGKAEVFLTKDLLKQGFFGKASKQLTDRLSNLVILSYAGQSVWWFEEGIFQMLFFGHHGGLTKEEMEIPFLSLSL